MSNAKLTSTDQFDEKQFRLHGRVEYEERGKMLLGTAVGPFNMELMDVLRELATKIFPPMAAKGPWAHVVTFRNSALCAPEVLKGLTEAMNQMVQAGVAPQVIAFVMPSDVEGYSLMGPLYARALGPTGVRFQYFQSYDEAHQWVKSVAGPLIA